MAVERDVRLFAERLGADERFEERAVEVRPVEVRPVERGVLDRPEDDRPPAVRRSEAPLRRRAWFDDVRRTFGAARLTGRGGGVRRLTGPPS